MPSRRSTVSIGMAIWEMRIALQNNPEVGVPRDGLEVAGRLEMINKSYWLNWFEGL